MAGVMMNEGQRARQEAARRRQEQPVHRRHCPTRRLPTENAEFVLQHDDFEFLEVG